jgi:hypothetical protein
MHHVLLMHATACLADPLCAPTLPHSDLLDDLQPFLAPVSGEDGAEYYHEWIAAPMSLYTIAGIIIATCLPSAAQQAALPPAAATLLAYVQRVRHQAQRGARLQCDAYTSYKEVLEEKLAGGQHGSGVYLRYRSILAAGLSKAGDVALLLELLPLNSETYNSLINPLTKHAKWIRVSWAGQ